jgi:CelD/BcsL family acetyltransferase involved in cellulose biosynthesis
MPEREIVASVEAFEPLRAEWNRIALPARNPFLTHEWQLAWWRAFGGDRVRALLLRDGEDQLLAGACIVSSSRRGIESAANDYSDDWDVVAADPPSRAAIWREIASLRGRTLTFEGVPGASEAAEARDALADAGYRVSMVEQQQSPYLALPDSWDQLLAGLSRNHRSQIRRQWKRLGEEGELRVTTRRGVEPELSSDLDRFFALEASGWKGEAGTAILDDPAAKVLYSEFAQVAAEQGRLRLYLLELDGELIAADYSCVIGDAAFLIKTCFDERHSKLAPGAVLRAEAIRAAIEEGLAIYEFLGGPDPYKTRWPGELRARMLVRGYRGAGLAAFYYRHELRPLAASLFRSRSGNPG